MRTTEGRYAGGGMLWAFRESEETYRDQRVGKVKFPSDGLDEEELEALSGPCITIKEGRKV